MSLFSVNTNVGAATALRQLGATTADLQLTQRRLATGQRVGSVRDNGAVWTIAQQQRGAVGGLEVVRSSLQRGQAVGAVALRAGETVSDLLTEIKARLLSATDAGLSAGQRAALNEDFQSLRDRIDAVVKGAEFAGVNLLKSGAADAVFLAGLSMEGTTVTTGSNGNSGGGNSGSGNSGGGGSGGNGASSGNSGSRGAGSSGSGGAGSGGNGNSGGVRTTTTYAPTSLTLRASSLALGGPNVTIGAGASFATAAEAASLLSLADASLGNVGRALARLGTDLGRLDRQLTFAGRLQDRLAAGVGDLLDADLGKESARLEALKVREQLGVQALGIANAQPKVLLSLFRG